MRSVLGWDIGGVNTKTALTTAGEVRCVLTRPFELQRSPGDLSAMLRDMAGAATAASGTAVTNHAVTMTAELSQMFRTKREGVAFVLGAVEAAFPGAAIHVYTVEGSFIPPLDARLEPLAVAAANWSATAHIVAQHHPDALLVDIGTTTTDLIPIVRGRVVASGVTDPERLASGELVYTGAVRTPVEAIVREVPLGDRQAAVSAEGFALAGDVHVWRGHLAPGDYAAPTPDGRPASPEFAGERLARIVCADREMVDAGSIDAIAASVANAQVAQIADGMRRMRLRHPNVLVAVVTGLGSFIGAAAARAAGFSVAPLSSHLGDAGARSAPATAVALLLDQHLASLGGPEAPPLRDRVDARDGAGVSDVGGASDVVGAGLQARPRATRGETPPDALRLTVVKLGGGLLSTPDQWRAAIAALADAALSRRLVIVPGGGAFADVVRTADERFGLSDDDAHWMAIGAMDQHAQMIAGALPQGVLVHHPAGVRQALAAGRIPVIAPWRWLRDVDPLPHSWDVTSDSIAAWIAGALEASELVLVKPEGASGPGAVDPYFPRALPGGLRWSIQPVRELSRH